MEHAIRKLVHVYVHIRQRVLDAGYLEEILWQETRCLSNLSEVDFLREYAWVVLSSGMRESVVRKVFPGISDAFDGFTSAKFIVENSARCESQAKCLFNHRAKIEAISNAASRVHAHGFADILAQLLANGVEFLRSFRFLGPATSYHLAKNIGMNVVKPDRHLIRITEAIGYETAHEMCSDIASHSGEKLSVVDLVLWRYATLTAHYVTDLRNSLAA